MGKMNPERNNHGTLGSAKALGQELWLRCTECGHSTRADLDALIAKLGASFTTSDVIHRVHCRECKTRWPHIGWELTGPTAPG